MKDMNYNPNNNPMYALIDEINKDLKVLRQVTINPNPGLICTNFYFYKDTASPSHGIHFDQDIKGRYNFEVHVHGEVRDYSITDDMDLDILRFELQMLGL